MILMKDIIKDGNKTLRMKAKQVNFPLSEKDKKLAKELMKYLIDSQDPIIADKHQLRAGVGLAAPQVNISKQMAAVLVPPLNDDESDSPLFKDIIINPIILSHSIQEAALAEGEGCLSVDKNILGYVPRYNKITLEYQNINGETKKIKLKGYPAIVCQHEIDHLNGILFYDHINKNNPFMLKNQNTVILS